MLGARGRFDKTLRGYKTRAKADLKGAVAEADLLIKNTYRTLMTCGMKGCYVYCSDKETASYFRYGLSTGALLRGRQAMKDHQRRAVTIAGSRPQAPGLSIALSLFRSSWASRAMSSARSEAIHMMLSRCRSPMPSNQPLRSP